MPAIKDLYMWVWIFMLLSLVGLWFLIPDGVGRVKKNLIYLTVSFIVIVFVVGSRSPHFYEVADLYNYYDRFLDVIYLPVEEVMEHSRMEPGYLYFTKFIGWLVPWGQFIIYFEAAVTTGIMFWYIYRNCDNVFLGVIFYVCIGSWQFFLTGFRQAFATVFCLVAFELLKKRRLGYDIAALAFMIFAASLHTMAWIFVSVFIIRQIKLTKRLFVYSLLIFAGIILFADVLIENINEMLESKYTGTYQGSFFGGIVPIATYVLALILVYLVWRRDNNAFDRNEQFEIIMLVFGLAIYLTRYDARVMERVSFFFTGVIPVVLSNALVRQTPQRAKHIACAVCVSLCLGLFIYRAIAQLSDYHFYWEYYEYIKTLGY